MYVSVCVYIQNVQYELNGLDAMRRDELDQPNMS